MGFYHVDPRINQEISLWAAYCILDSSLSNLANN